VSQREINQLAEILTDPENQNRSAEQLAGMILDRVYALALTSAKASIRDETRREIFDKDAAERRLAVVGQIAFGPQEPAHTVVLGPFRSTVPLKSHEGLADALKRPNVAARDAGQHLAWDSRTGTGSGRFMLAPAFMRPRDAWDFYRLPKASAGEPMNLLLPPPPHIAEAVERWSPGLWAREFNA
jgi:hypothetical protein